MSLSRLLPKVFPHVDWSASEGLYYSSRSTMRMVRKWIRSTHPSTYADWAMTHGFLEVLDPIELGICTIHSVYRDGKFPVGSFSRPCRAARSVKLYPWAIEEYDIVPLLDRYGRDFWEWIHRPKQESIRREIRGISEELRLTFEFQPEMITHRNAQLYLAASLRLGRYMDEVITTIATMRGRTGTVYVADLSDDVILIFDPKIPDSIFRRLAEERLLTPRVIARRLIQYNRLETLRWLVAREGPHIIHPEDVKMVISEVKGREMTKYLIETLQGFFGSPSIGGDWPVLTGVAYSNLDLIPDGDIGNIRVDNISPEKLSLPWLRQHLHRTACIIEFADMIPAETFLALHQEFGSRVSLSDWMLVGYSEEELSRIVDSLVSAGGTTGDMCVPADTSPEKVIILRRYCHGTIRPYRTGKPKTPLESWDFSQWHREAARHQVSL
jgi:hypothetical protein